MPPQDVSITSLPPIGADVTHLNVSAAMPTLPAIGDEVPADLAPASQKTVMDQLGDLFGTTLQQVNPFPSLMKANTEMATVLQKVIEGKLHEAGDQAVKDLKVLGSGLATALNLPTTARSDIYARGVKSFKEGNISTAAEHFKAWLMPLVGPALSEAAQEDEQGNWGKAGGLRAGSLLNVALPAAMSKLGAMSKVGVAVDALPEEAIHGGNMTRADLGAALKPPVAPVSPLASPIPETATFADANKIPITGGTRAGSEVLKSIQQLNAKTNVFAEHIDQTHGADQAARMNTVGRDMARGLAPTVETPETAGSMAQQVGEAAQRQAAEMGVQVEGAYDKASAGIANRVAPHPVSMFEAGQQQVAELEDVADQFAQKAKGHYEALRDGSKAYTQDVVVGYEDSQLRTHDGAPAVRTPIIKTVEFPIDIAKEQADIVSLYEKLKREWPVAQQQNSAGFKALENLAHSQPVLALDELEDALGAVKSIVRRATGKSQGLAKLVVSKIEQAIGRSVREADADHLLDELRAGRAATAKKYEVLELVGSLNGEPAKAAAMLTQFGDKGAELLKDVTSVAPQASRALARAVLQSLFDSMMDNGKLSLAKAGAAGNRWAQIGDITKRILFTNAETRAQIDRFFQQAARASRQRVVPNLKESPVSAFDALVQPRDANVHQLEALARVAPELPQMFGRAWFEERLDRLFVDPKKMTGAQGVIAEWRKMGPRTRRMLFGAQEKSIGTFLQLAMDESFVGNSSRTAYMEVIAGGFGAILLHNPLALIGAAGFSLARGALARVMWDKQASEALIAAMKTPVSAKNAATVASARVLNQAKRLGVPVETIQPAAKVGALGTNVVKGSFGAPKAAEQQQEQPPTASTPNGTPVGRFIVTEQPPAQ